ncbi:MAG TPA: GTP-binding protein [Isosphaeraceae bacterium]
MVATLGHINSGKTTLTAAITQVLARHVAGNVAHSYDSLHRAPVERGPVVSIAASRVEYETRAHRYTHVDCPSREDYSKGLLSGALQPDVGILVVSAADGPMPDTRLHLELARAIGVRSIVVFQNKIDLVDDEELLELVELEMRELLKRCGYPGDTIPIIRGSALPALENPGDPAAARPILALLKAMDSSITQPVRDEDRPFLMAVEGISSIKGRGTVVTGKIDRGVVKVGDPVEILGAGGPKRSVVTAIERSRKAHDQGRPGDRVDVLLRGAEKGELEGTQVIGEPGSIASHSKFESWVYLFSEDEGGRNAPFLLDDRTQFAFRTISTPGTILKLQSTTNLEIPKSFGGYDFRMTIELLAPIPLEEGCRFSIVEGEKTVGIGVVTKTLP